MQSQNTCPTTVANCYLHGGSQSTTHVVHMHMTKSHVPYRGWQIDSIHYSNVGTLSFLVCSLVTGNAHSRLCAQQMANAIHIVIWMEKTNTCNVLCTYRLCNRLQFAIPIY